MTNFDLEKIVDTTDEWITTRTGIKERRVAADGQACSELAERAARNALEMAGVDALDLDAVIVATITGDMPFPATATFVQDRLGAKNAAAFDLSAACSGFIYGINIAHGMIASGQMDRILVVGAEVLSKFLDWEDRSTCVLFGDGAGAAVVEGCNAQDGILSTYMKSDGALADLLCIPGGGSLAPFDQTTVLERSHYIKMKGDGVFKWAVRAMADSARRVVADAGYALDDIALYVPHQANIRIIEAVAKRLGLSMDKVVVTIGKYGNMSSATIPVALDEWVRGGKIRRGDNVLMAAFGGGLTWGAALVEW